MGPIILGGGSIAAVYETGDAKRNARLSVLAIQFNERSTSTSTVWLNARNKNLDGCRATQFADDAKFCKLRKCTLGSTEHISLRGVGGLQSRMLMIERLHIVVSVSPR